MKQSRATRRMEETGVPGVGPIDFVADIKREYATRWGELNDAKRVLVDATYRVDMLTARGTAPDADLAEAKRDQGRADYACEKIRKKLLALEAREDLFTHENAYNFMTAAEKVLDQDTLLKIFIEAKVQPRGSSKLHLKRSPFGDHDTQTRAR